MPCIDCSVNLNYSKNYVCDKCAYVGGLMDCKDDWKDLKVSGAVIPSISADIDSWEREAIVVASNVMHGRPGNIYCMLDAGMGCNWFVRRNATNKFEAFFMHGDNWGQHGSSTDDTINLRKFLEGYDQF